MLYAVLTVLAVISLLSTYSTIKTYQKGTTMSTMLGNAIVACAMVFWAYVANYVVKDRNAEALFCCLQKIGVLWTYYFLIRFSFAYIRDTPLNPTAKNVSLAILMIDSAVILTSPINGLAFDIVFRKTAYNEVAAAEPKLFFWVHFALCVMEYATIVFLLISRMRRSAGCYALRYILVIGLTTFMAVPDAIYVFWKQATYDYSVIFFGIAGIVFYYAVYVFSPVVVLNQVHSYFSEFVPDPIILYDSDGSLLSRDDRAESILSEKIPQNESAFAKKFNLTEHETASFSKGGRNYIVSSERIHDSHGKHVLTSYIFKDVTETEKAFNREHRNATTDVLTGIYNRSGFFEKAETFLEEHGSENCYAVLISGLNNFKDVNRLYGTKVGDMVLKAAAHKFLECTSMFPLVVGRTAESKFSALLPFDEVDGLVSKMSSVEVEVSDDIRVSVDMRHGFVVMNENLSFEEYYELAVAAFVASKKNEGFSVVEFSKDLREEQLKRQTLISDAKNALKNKEFSIELRPHINFKTGKVVGAKARIHWNHPVYGRLEEDEFLDIFTDSGMVSELNKTVWPQAAATLERFKGSSLFDGYISVELDRGNILNNANLLDELKSLIEEYGLKPDQLHLVIKRIGGMENPGLLSKILTEIRRNGFFIEEADFGQGLATVGNILTIPFDGEIMHMKFLREAIAGDPEGTRTAQAFVDAFTRVGAKIVVVGVDTEEDKNIVDSLGLSVAEGLCFSGAVPLKTFASFVKKYNK